MDNISKILSNINHSKPEVIDQIKLYIDKKYSENISVGIRNNAVLIEANNSSLANAIRYELPYIKENITDKKIIIRTSRS